MKRLAIAVTTVVALLAAAGGALAAVNNYTATYKFSGGKGTAAKPAALSFNQTIKIQSGTAGQTRTGILHTIKTTIDGVKVDAKGFPTCTAAVISQAGTDAKCNKKALIATGSISALIGDATDATMPGAACDPDLHVWNAGPGKLAFFFVEEGSHQCLNGALHTGQVAPFPASYKQAGKNLDVTIPIPHFVDYPVAGQVGSLSSEILNWKSQTVNGNPDIMSTGCSSSKRAYTFTFNASPIGSGAAETSSVKGAAACG